MASHSEHAGFIRGLGSTLLVDGGPMDTGAARDAIVSNLQHLHDEHAQQLAAMAWPAGSYAELGGGEAPSVYLRNSLLDCRFPLHVREDTGDSFLVVPYLWVDLIDAASDMDVILWLTLGGPPASPPVYVASDPSMRQFTISSGAAHAEEPDPLYIPAARVRAAYPDRWPTHTSSRSDGSLGAAETLAATLSVWAKWTVTDAAAAVYVLNLREYVGS
jgi:hypothetical protein